MRIAFRADSSRQVGAGHVIRCKTLADELGKRGAKIKFVCAELSEDMFRLLDEAGHMPTMLLPGGIPEVAVSGPGTSREVRNQAADAERTAAVLSGFDPDWLIVDHYQLDISWEGRLRGEVGHLMVLDDLADRKHDCDLLVDPTYGESEVRYRELVVPATKCLCGAEYALLRPQFLALRAQGGRTIPSAETMSVHVFFGSADPGNHTLRFSRLLLERFDRLRINAVVGRTYSFGDDLAALAAAFAGRFSWHRDIPDMASSMAVCHVALGAPGGATWERAALGLPAVYLAVAPSQEKVLESLHASGLCRYLGKADRIGNAAFLDAMEEFLSDIDALRRMSARGQEAVDARGTQRVADILEAWR